MYVGQDITTDPNKQPVVDREQREQVRLQQIRSRVEIILLGSCNNLNERMGSYRAPVIECASDVSLSDLLEKLLIKGANPNIWTLGLGTPLHLCCGHTPNLAGAELLLNYGANIDERMASSTITAVSQAAELVHSDLVKLFLERGANPNLEDIVANKAKTPLMYALEGAWRNQPSAKIIVGLLLFYGADPFKCNKQGENAIVVAKNLKLPAFSVLLANAQKNLRANLTKVLSRGHTPFDNNTATLIAHCRYS